jgi:hypothetical protein
VYEEWNKLFAGGLVMRRMGAVIAAASIFAFVATAQAQTSSASGQAGAQAPVETGKKPEQNASINASLAGGWPISAELRTSLDSKKAKQGDAIEARMTEAVKANGKTILPGGTKLVGHVTQVSAKSKGDAGSSLGLAFDKAVLKGGDEIPLNVSIQALATPGAAQGSSAVDNMATSPPGTPVNSGVPGGVNSREMSPGMSSGSPGNRPINTGGTSGEASSGTSGGTPSGTLNAAGKLTPNSHGVFGVQGGVLKPETSNGTGSLITSTGKNLRLDSGTQLLLVTQETNAAETSKP